MMHRNSPFMRAWLLTLLLVGVMVALCQSPTRTIIAAPPATPERQLFLPLTAHEFREAGSARALFSAFIPDGLAQRDMDEAFAIQNIGDAPMFLGGMQVTDGEGAITLPDLILAPGQMAWCAKQAVAFAEIWARKPDCEYQSDTDPAVPNATGASLNLSNAGDELQLLLPGGMLADTVVYKNGDIATDGWKGDALQPYQPSNAFASEGQVYYRLFDAATLLPALSDSDTARDWAQGNRNPIIGRRTAYPGWHLYTFSRPEDAPFATPRAAQVLIAPDNALSPILQTFQSAQKRIFIETYELTHPWLVQSLAQKARSGVDVRVLLEGSPVRGLTDDARWAAQQLSEAGARVDFMVNDVGNAHDRYPYLHGKFAIIDDETVLISTENFKLSSLPADAADGDTVGRRGYAVIIRDASLWSRAITLFSVDDDRSYPDIFPWQADHPQYGRPHDPDYQPPRPEDLSGYQVRHPHPIQVDDVARAVMFTAPEASLAPLLDLIQRAGPGDVIFTQQLYEHPWWGAENSHAAQDPNVRLEALIAAARRGAVVRILLDSFFDNPYDTRSNLTTMHYINDIARREGLDMQAQRGNPTQAGLHAKLHLIALGDERWVVVGSMNGSEASNKLNREMGLALQSVQAFNQLKEVFDSDWRARGPGASIPADWRTLD